MEKMIINRYNYQEFFLLYTDNELDAIERKGVEDFVQQNPDLREELMMLQQTILKPDEQLQFDNKDVLLQFGDTKHFIYPGNFEEFAIAYVDKELSEEDEIRLEQFVQQNPDFQEEFNLINSLKIPADDSIVYPDKALLYRSERERRPVLFPWWRISAAAIVLLVAGFLWLSKNEVVPVIPKDAVTKTADSSNKSALVAEESKKPGEKKSNKQADIPIGPAISKVENVAITDKKNGRYSKKEVFSITASHEARVHQEKNIKNNLPDDSKNQPTIANNTLESLPSSHIRNREQTELPDKLSSDLATLASTLEIERTGKITGEPLVIKTNAPVSNNYYAVQTVANVDGDDDAIGSSDKKSPLRGILRKASRFIDKNTASRTSKKSGLLIGNIEIAFQ